MKVLTVVSARPQFIKAAVVSHILRNKHEEILVHTGQHYDYNMSERFFEEMDIPDPDYNLGISGGSHAEMTGKMMIKIEEVLKQEKPDMLLVYGDTNSTLAAALAAVKLHISICHVEAGARTYNRKNPEEINRLCTDQVSELLLTSTTGSLEKLEKEGLGERGRFVGDPMYDAFRKYSSKMDIGKVKLDAISAERVSLPEKFYYLTCHREENTNDDRNLTQILMAMENLDERVIYPVHPRNKERVVRLKKDCNFKNTLFVEPVGYLESVCMVSNAKKTLQIPEVYKGKLFLQRRSVLRCWILNVDRKQ